MNHIGTLLALFISVLALAGCATMSPHVRLNPAPSASAVKFDTNPELFLTVHDARTEESLGLLLPRGNDPRTPATSVLPVEDGVRIHMENALAQAGFHIQPVPGTTTPQLVVQVKRLEFKLEKGMTWSEIKGAGELTMVSKVGTTTREKTYSAETGKVWALRPPANGHEQFLNQILADILNSFLSDKDFLSFLASASDPSLP